MRLCVLTEENMNCDGISILLSEHVGIVGHHGAVPFYLISRVKGKRVGFVCMCTCSLSLQVYFNESFHFQVEVT